MIKVLILKFLRSFGYDVVKTNPGEATDNIVRLINRYQINLVLDVGANEGQYAKRIIRNGFKGEIISFEPVSSAFEALKQNTLKHSNWKAADRCAVGNENKAISINISENIVSSSVLNIKSETVDFAPETKYIRKEKVQLRTLNSFFNEHFSKSDEIFLKLDVQGLERMVLEGANEMLHLVKGIQFETSLFQLYEDEPVLDEMLSYVSNLGYELYDLAPGYRDPSTNRLTQVDCIFIRKD